MKRTGCFGGKEKELDSKFVRQMLCTHISHKEFENLKI